MNRSLNPFGWQHFPLGARVPGALGEFGGDWLDWGIDHAVEPKVPPANGPA